MIVLRANKIVAGHLLSVVPRQRRLNLFRTFLYDISVVMSLHALLAIGINYK